MAKTDGRNTLQGLCVNDAMRKQLVRKARSCSIANAINELIKYKANALLVTDSQGEPIGVVSKTDIMNAYYAGLSIDSPLELIMNSPPLYCAPEESLGKALERMRSKGVYRLYARSGESGNVVGALAYPDIVGLLYQYCHYCEFGRHRRQHSPERNREMLRYRVREVMTSAVKSMVATASLVAVMEELSAYRFGALLITDPEGRPCGVISKTDLTLAYKHGTDPGIAAARVMHSPVHTCCEDDLLEDAIRTMIFTDIQRLFVHRGHPREIVGVLSLSDAARVRSGSCHACVSSRIKVEDHD